MTKNFDKLTEAALIKILIDDDERLLDYKFSAYENGQLTLIVDSAAAFEQRLIFHDATIPEGLEIPLYFSEFQLVEQENGYCLGFNQAAESEIQTHHKVFFQTANVEIHCFNYTKFIIPYDQLWGPVVHYLYEMRNKRDRIGEEFLNEEEKQILPLTDFIPLMQYFNTMMEDIILKENGEGIEADNLVKAGKLFISFAERAQAKEIVKLAQQYVETSNKKTLAFTRKLMKEMTSTKAEVLYRLILDQIKNAAARYPDRIDVNGKNTDAYHMRKLVSSFFYSQGFQGTYPSFRKMSSFTGPRMIIMGNSPDVFWRERHMASFIECYEDCIDGGLSVNYVAGTVLLRKDQTDLFHDLSADSGFFNDRKNRRRRRAIINQTYWGYDEYSSFQDENLKAADIAARVSQCERITRQERKKYLSGMEVGFLLAIVSVIAGLLFGIILCAGLFLMAVITGLIIERSFPWELLQATPWHRYFLFGGISFSILMYIVFSLGSRRA